VRVGVRMEQLAVTVRTKGPAHALANGPDDADQTQPERTLLIPWQKAPSKRRREIIVTSFIGAQDTRPIRADTRAKLVASIARGRRWLQEIISGAVTDAEKIAAREQCSVRHVNMSISLAFLAPDLVKAATEGRLPRGIGVARLCDGPSEWSRRLRNTATPAPGAITSSGSTPSERSVCACRMPRTSRSVTRAGSFPLIARSISPRPSRSSGSMNGRPSAA
jgi:hypothetical protein